MSAQAIIDRIVHDAEEECAEILRAAEAEAAAIMKHAEQKAEEAYQHRMHEGLRDISQEMAAKESKARIEAKRKVRLVTDTEIQECLDLVREEIQKVRHTSEYPAIFEELFKASVTLLSPGPLVISVHPDDLDLASSLCRRFASSGIPITIADTPLDTCGGVLCERLSDRVSIDNTFEGRLTRLYPDLAGVAFRHLFPKR